MQKPCIIFTVILLSVVTFASNVSSAERKLEIDSLRIHEGVLLVDLNVDGLINDKMLEGLERGLTSVVEYRVQLWKRKSLVSQLVAETYYRVKLYFDHWERKFAIISEDENRLTSSSETLREKCSEVRRLALTDTSKLNPEANYFVTAKMTYEPISTENYQQLRKWIQGEMGSLDPSKQREPPKHSGGSRSRLFNVFINLLGFGNKVLSAKSDYFTFRSDSLISLK